MSDPTAPPIGVKPRWVHDETRFKDLAEAIGRYAQARLPVPVEWTEEYNDLAKRRILPEPKT